MAKSSLCSIRKSGKAAHFLEIVVLNYDDDDCLIWPFARNSGGYGYIKRSGRMTPVHRLACEHFNGAPPTPSHEASHSCGSGHLGCVNERHLSWKTPAGNQADRVAHGTDSRGERCVTAKLTEADVRQIRGFKGSKSQAKIAAQFRVSRETVSQIYTRRVWGWLK